MNNIFNGLESLGFTNLDKQNLFEVPKEEAINTNSKAKNNLTHTFDKKIDCPICTKTFITPSVKVNSPRISSKDSDFFIRYSIINPYFYDVYLCPSCGYAAMKSDFQKVKSFQIPLVKKNITSKWISRTYSLPFTEDIAIERYKLALLNSMIIEAKNSTKAMICLKIAWMYRLLNDSSNEKVFLNQALLGFSNAYFNEAFPMYGLDKFSLEYLIGELHRRLDKNTDALKWFSQVLTATGASRKIKDLARDGKDNIRGN